MNANTSVPVSHNSLPTNVVSVPHESSAYCEKTPMELAVLNAGGRAYDGCDHCPICLMLLKVSLGKNPVTSLFGMTTRDPLLQDIVSRLLKFEISSQEERVDTCKRGLCRFHALHYKLYVHRFNIDTMIAIREFVDTAKVLDDGTIEQIFANLDKLEAIFEKNVTKWIKDMQARVLHTFTENVEKEFICLKGELRNRLRAKELQLEKRIEDIYQEKEEALDEAEARLQVQMQAEKFKKAKFCLDTYGRVYRSASSTGQPNLLHLMRRHDDDERNVASKFDEELRAQYIRKVDKAKERQERDLAVWKQKLDAHRKQEYCVVRDTTEKFQRGKQNRLQRLRDVQVSEAKKIIDDFRKHAVHMRSLAMRRGVSVQTTTLRPITPIILGYMLLVLKRALPPSLHSRTIMKDGIPLHDSKAGTVLAQFAAWIDESPELAGLSGRDIFCLMDQRRCGRITSNDLQQFVVGHNILLQPSILFNTLPKEDKGVIQLDDFLMAMRPLELEYEIAVTELLFTWLPGGGGTSAAKKTLSTKSQGKLLGTLRTVAVRVLQFLRVREPKYDRDDDIMFYRVHNFSQQKSRLTLESRSWEPNASASSQPRPLSPTSERGGFMHTGRYQSSGPRLTLAPPEHSPQHRVMSDEHGHQFFMNNMEANHIELARREVLDNDTGSPGGASSPSARAGYSGLSVGLGDPAKRFGFLHFSNNLKRTVPSTQPPLHLHPPRGLLIDKSVLHGAELETANALSDAANSPRIQKRTLSHISGVSDGAASEKSHLVKKAHAYHELAHAAVFGSREHREQNVNSAAASARSTSSPSPRSGAPERSARRQSEIGILGNVLGSASDLSLSPHKPQYNLHAHSKPNFSAKNVGKIGSNFMLDPAYKTRKSLEQSSTHYIKGGGGRSSSSNVNRGRASIQSSGNLVKTGLMKFTAEGSPSRLGSPESRTGAESARLFRTGSTVEMHEADTKGGIHADEVEMGHVPHILLDDMDLNGASPQALAKRVSQGGSRSRKSPHHILDERMKNPQLLGRRQSQIDRSLSIAEKRRRSREEKTKRKSDFLDNHYKAQDAAHSSTMHVVRTEAGRVISRTQSKLEDTQFEEGALTPASSRSRGGSPASSRRASPQMTSASAATKQKKSTNFNFKRGASLLGGQMNFVPDARTKNTGKMPTNKNKKATSSAIGTRETEWSDPAEAARSLIVDLGVEEDAENARTYASAVDGVEQPSRAFATGVENDSGGPRHSSRAFVSAADELEGDVDAVKEGGSDELHEGGEQAENGSSSGSSLVRLSTDASTSASRMKEVPSTTSTAASLRGNGSPTFTFYPAEATGAGAKMMGSFGAAGPPSSSKFSATKAGDSGAENDSKSRGTIGATTSSSTSTSTGPGGVEQGSEARIGTRIKAVKTSTPKVGMPAFNFHFGTTPDTTGGALPFATLSGSETTGGSTSSFSRSTRPAAAADKTRMTTLNLGSWTGEEADDREQESSEVTATPPGLRPKTNYNVVDRKSSTTEAGNDIRSRTNANLVHARHHGGSTMTTPVLNLMKSGVPAASRTMPSASPMTGKFIVNKSSNPNIDDGANPGQRTQLLLGRRDAAGSRGAPISYATSSSNTGASHTSGLRGAGHHPRTQHNTQVDFFRGKNEQQLSLRNSLPASARTQDEDGVRQRWWDDVMPVWGEKRENEDETSRGDKRNANPGTSSTTSSRRGNKKPPQGPACISIKTKHSDMSWTPGTQASVEQYEGVLASSRSGNRSKVVSTNSSKRSTSSACLLHKSSSLNRLASPALKVPSLLDLRLNMS